MGLNVYYGRNPSGIGATTYSRMLVERAPDAAGAPGAFVQIADILIDTTDEFTAYVDTSGQSTDWYRHRWWDGGVVFSGYLDTPIQVGSNTVKTWLMADLPDADITSPFWDRWIARTLIDLYAFGVWKLDYQDITPTKTNPGIVDQTYSITGTLRDLTKIEVMDSAKRAVDYTLVGGEWKQRGRTIFLPNAKDGEVYRVWGKRTYAAVGEMTDDYFELVFWLVVTKYFWYRKFGRGNYRAYIVLDRAADISPEQLAEMEKTASQQVALRTAALGLPEEAIPVMMGDPFEVQP